jgi:restriction system protein
VALWEYRDAARDLDWDSVSSPNCLFCNQVLLHSRPLDPWDVDDPTMGSVLVGDIRLCRTCGWWSASRSEGASWPVGNDIVSSVTGYGAMGSLKELGLPDIQVPLWEAREFLTKRFERRCELDPRLVQETVVSVFESLGYQVQATAFRNDGGIDGVLSRNTEPPIGIQVKRTKNKIEAEQIRSFAGALLLHDKTVGVYVTMSSFTAGAQSTAANFKDRLLRIELVDAARFLEALGIAQRAELPSREQALALLSNLTKLYSSVSPPPEEWKTDPW